MSQVGAASRSASQLKMGVSLPDIQHPLSRMSNPDNLDVRGVSRAGDRPASHPDQGSGRPLASENGNYPMGRKSISAAGRESRLKKEAHPPGGTIKVDSIPEGVEVKYGDPGATRLPVFGERPPCLLELCSVIPILLVLGVWLLSQLFSVRVMLFVRVTMSSQVFVAILTLFC